MDVVIRLSGWHYVDGEGGFIIEDQFLITEDGAQAAWSLPRGLVEVPA